MALRFPATKNTPGKRLRYVLRWKERARLIHNLMGLWTRDGLTQAQYDNGVDSGLLNGVAGVTIVLPTVIKGQQAYQLKLPRAVFREWQSSLAAGGFGRMDALIHEAESTQRALICDETGEDADIDVDRLEP